MDYVNRMQQKNGQVEGSVFDIGTIVHVVQAIGLCASSIRTLVSTDKSIV